jgi:hypothetical protein
MCVRGKQVRVALLDDCSIVLPGLQALLARRAAIGTPNEASGGG